MIAFVAAIETFGIIVCSPVVTVMNVLVLVDKVVPLALVDLMCVVVMMGSVVEVVFPVVAVPASEVRVELATVVCTITWVKAVTMEVVLSMVALVG